MKKRLLSALLALALVFVLLPTTALAGVTRGSGYDISINGTNHVFSDSETCYFKSSFTSTAPSSPYLKLTKSSDTITVIVSGYVTVSDISVHNNFSTQDKINLIITGNKGSTLNIECKDTYGAALETYQSGDITIKDGITVNANFSADYTDKYTDCYGIRASKNLIITGKGTTVNAVNADDAAAVKVDGNITVSDGAQLKATNKYSKKVTNYTGNAYAIECGGQFSISGENTKVTAKTSNGEKAISGTVYNLTENDDYKLTFKAGRNEGDPFFDDPKPMDKALGYEYVEITQAPTNPYVRIAGEPAIIGQETPIPGGTGTYLYKKTLYEGRFLTLKDVNITHSDGAIVQFMAGAPYIIKLEGTNSIKDVSSFIRVPERGYESLDGLSVTISGSGSLEVTARSNAINMEKGDLKFENTGEIKLTTSNIKIDKAYNVLSVSGDISITDMDKYSVTGITKTGGNVTGETVTLSAASHLKGYKNPDGTPICLKTITITPAAAKDSTIRYNGTTLKQGETIRNGGTATVDSKNNTITLKNFNGTAALSFDATLADSTLVLEGTNTLSSIVTTQKGLTISGSGSLTVGSIRVTNNDNIRADLTITGGAHVTVNRPSEDKPAVEVSGNLTVTGEGTQLSAECTAATNPAIEVGGNVTISGDPGTNAYTVKAYNKYAIQRGRDDKLRPSQMPSAFEISGNLSISGSAQVMAQTDSDGAAVWMPKQKVISVVDASLIAQNRSHNFSTISFGDESNMGNIYAKGQEVNIVAENMLGSNSSLAHRAIKAFIYNHYNTGDSNPYYIKVVSEGVQSGGNVNVIPGHCTSTGGYKVTITRGDAYTTPQVAANYTIAGQTMYVGKYYKTDTNGNITDGTAQDYNIYCDSANDFTLNNATISSTGTGGSTGVIMTNLNASSNEIHIKLIGKNSINNAGHHAILGEGAYSTIFIENAENASNASLTISGNYLPVYSYGNVTINAEVVIINTNGNLISTNKDGHANGAFDLGSGYKCYASASTTGNPLEEFNPANYSTYKYLRVTTQTLETGGGSTHQHTSETGWETDGTNHWKTCSTCSQKYNEGACTISGYNNDNGASGYHKVLCSVGHVMKTELHDYEYKITQDGTMHYKECKTCHYTTPPVSHNFGSSGTESCECGTIPSHTHNLSGQKGNDETNHWDICSECSQHVNEAPHTYGDWITDTPATDTTDGSKHRTCSVCQYQENATIPKTGTGEIVPPTPDNPGTIVIIRPAEEEKPAQQPNPSTGANDLVGLAVAAAVAAALGSAALLRKHD